MSGLPTKAQDRINTFGIILIGITAGILLWVSVVALQAYYYSSQGEVERQRDAEGKGREVRDLHAAQAAALQDSKYVDPAKGLVTVPIETAMSKVLEDARGGAGSLVPAVGAHDTPTVRARGGRPSDTDPAGTGAGAAPAPGGEGAAPAPAGEGAAPAPAGEGAAPAGQPDARTGGQPPAAGGGAATGGRATGQGGTPRDPGATDSDDARTPDTP